MTHLIDKNFTERANAVLLLGILWAGSRFASSARWPTTCSTGWTTGELRTLNPGLQERRTHLPVFLNRGIAMQRRHLAKDSDFCLDCGARFITAPCRSCNGTGHLLLLFKCRDCRGTGKKAVCPNFLSHLRAQPGPERSLANNRDTDAMTQ
jgi:hypothetical protein